MAFGFMVLAFTFPLLLVLLSSLGVMIRLSLPIKDTNVPWPNLLVIFTGLPYVLIVSLLLIPAIRVSV
jgi:hypothetical protein